MADESIPGDAKAFAAYAEFDIRRWQLIRGERIVHTVFGDGIIQRIEQPTTQSITISVRFANNQSKRLGSTIFRNPTVITFLTASERIWQQVAVHSKELAQRDSWAAHMDAEKQRRLQHLRKQIELQIQAEEPLRREAEKRRLEKSREAEERRLRKVKEAEERRLQDALAAERLRRRQEKIRQEERQQKAREAASAAEFAHLKRKYYASMFGDCSPISPLYAILHKVDQHDELAEDELDWLKKQSAVLAGTAAYYFERQYKETGQPHFLTQACSNWRQFGRPERVLELTMKLDTIQNRKSRAFLFTTRGGAFRDLDNLGEAEQCANRAIDLVPEDSYPFRLRGAVFFQRGQAEQGYEDFQEADRLDEQAGLQRSGTTRKDMETALEKASISDQKYVAEFLIQKDPVKFKWARYYLDHSQGKNW